MTKFDTAEIRRVLVATLGAVAISATCLFAAAAPVKAETPGAMAAWTTQLEQRIAKVPVADPRLAPDHLRTAEVAAHFDADGGFTGARLAHSSGDAAVDAGAVAVASRLAYPRLPQAARGLGRDVTLRLHFGDASVVAPAAPRVEIAALRGDQVAAR